MFASGHAYASNQYQNVATHTGVAAADPHGLIRMLLAGVIERAGAARVAIINKNYDLSSNKIGAASAILAELRTCLDHSQGGPLAAQLDDLYEYSQRRLIHAIKQRDQEALLEVMDLISQIHNAWIEMR